ncbi:MAG: DUF1015 domain-containing protein [Dehalococcoidales bacterium]|nr:DUF1015 domain-containing protein [Dehalococcoidales bacterium]
MAEIRPFRGVHYSGPLVQDLAKVICPPYDIITPQLQQELYHRSEYNFVRVEYGRELPQDTATDNRYTRAATTLEEWLQQGIFQIDQAPAIYLHDHFFTHRGQEYKRRGMMVRVRLEPWDRMVVRPHEGTLAQPKSDRVSLLRVLQANTSPILAMFEDRDHQVASLLESRTGKPQFSLTETNGERHCVWAITEPPVIHQISQNLIGQPLYIADGHHRYESALAYQREQSASSPTSGDAAFNFVMMTLVDFTDPGLLILAPHRLLRGISRPALNELPAKLPAFFDIEELSLSLPDVWQRIEHSLLAAGETRFFLFGLKADSVLALKLRDLNLASRMMPYFHSETYKRLDVSITDHIIIENLLGVTTQDETTIAYTHDIMDAVNRVRDQEYQLAFLLKPVKSTVIKAIADVSDRMPRKSTYFYPKLPAGLVLNLLR